MDLSVGAGTKVRGYTIGKQSGTEISVYAFKRESVCPCSRLLGTKSGQGLRLVSSKNDVLIVPVLIFTEFVHSKCTGTQFCQLCLDQSETALEVGRAQDLRV